MRKEINHYIVVRTKILTLLKVPGSMTSQVEDFCSLFILVYKYRYSVRIFLK